MNVTLTLDPETEELIAKKAGRQGLTVAEYIDRLARRSAHAKPRRPKPSKLVALESPADRLEAIIERADPVELRANGVTLPKRPGNTGADLLRNLTEAGLTGTYGDSNIDSPELARLLREQAQKRDWS